MGRLARRRNTRLAKLRDAERTLGPDTSLVIYEFPDGWTIRQQLTHSDLVRVGVLMRNCLVDEPDWVEPAFDMRTLNDPDGYPRLVFHHLDGESMDINGYENSDPQPHHLERLRQWHQHAGLGAIFSDWRQVADAVSAPP